MRVTMTERGEQPRAYADQVWEWIIVADEGEECSPEWCFEHIIKNSEYKRLASALPEAEYRTRRWDGPFDSIMETVCKGWYTFKEMGLNQYCFTIKKEYID